MLYVTSRHINAINVTSSRQANKCHVTSGNVTPHQGDITLHQSKTYHVTSNQMSRHTTNTHEGTSHTTDIKTKTNQQTDPPLSHPHLTATTQHMHHHTTHTIPCTTLEKHTCTPYHTRKANTTQQHGAQQ